MKSILLCEGESDQILLSYYFINQFQFDFSKEHTKKANSFAKIGTINSYIQSIDLTGQEENEIAMWAVGGREKLQLALEVILELNRVNADLFFERIIIVADKDSDVENTMLWEDISQVIAKHNITIQFKENEWILGKQKSGFNENKNIAFLALNIPSEGEGALETFLLNALKEQGKAEKYLALKSEKFVETLVKNRDKFNNKYLSKRRQCTKAPLAVFFAITSPDKVFTEMDQMLKSVHWEKYKTIQSGFEQFNCFSVTKPQ